MSLKKQNKDNRLEPKYYGPYKVLQRIGTMSYKLELLPYSNVHPVFHVSCLKKVIGGKIPVQTILQEINEEGKTIVKLEKNLETRVKKLRNRAITEYLIKWKSLPFKEVTWEDKFFMQKHLRLIKC
jgi:hypothetical protein